jgi:hypothetical protein
MQGSTGLDSKGRHIIAISLPIPGSCKVGSAHRLILGERSPPFKIPILGFATLRRGRSAIKSSVDRTGARK